MLRFIILAGLALTTIVQSAHCQQYEDIGEDRATRMGVATIAKGKITIAKVGDVYKVSSEVQVRREGKNASAVAVVGLVLLDDKCKPTVRVVSTHYKGSVGGDALALNGSADAEIEIDSKSFESAKGYLLIVKSERKSIPGYGPELAKFIEAEVPSWQKVVAAYRKLNPGDASKSFGHVVVRRLR